MSVFPEMVLLCEIGTADAVGLESLGVIVFKGVTFSDDAGELFAILVFSVKRSDDTPIIVEDDKDMIEELDFNPKFDHWDDVDWKLYVLEFSRLEVLNNVCPISTVDKLFEGSRVIDWDDIREFDNIVGVTLSVKKTVVTSEILAEDIVWPTELVGRPEIPELSDTDWDLVV